MFSYHEGEKEARLHRQLSQKAVELAVQGRWEEAVAVNRDIIEKVTDVEAYNRLGRALIGLEDFDAAKEAYAKALEVSPNNSIAKKNLARLDSLPQSIETVEVKEPGVKRKARTKTQGINPALFIAEMGKVGRVKLRNMASSDVQAKLVVGDRMHLRIKGQCLIVETEQGEHVGEVEPKHALRLIKLIKTGNRYEVAILNIGNGEGRVIIKEVYQHPSQVGYLSFPVKGVTALRPSSKESLLKRSIQAFEGDLEEALETKETEYLGNEKESELEGFTMLDESIEIINEESIE